MKLNTKLFHDTYIADNIGDSRFSLAIDQVNDFLIENFIFEDEIISCSGLYDTTRGPALYKNFTICLIWKEKV